MKSANDLKARLGGNMRESMGASRPAGVAQPAPAASVFHGGTEKYQGAARIKDALAIELDRLMPDPDQPRKEFDPESIADLAASLRARGQLQPIRVRHDDRAARWIIIAGERRYRAAIQAGLTSLMCIEAKGELSADDILEDQLVENCLREDLKPMDQARAFRALLDRRGWSYRQLAESLHVGLATITRALSLLDLPTPIREQVEQGALHASVAYEVSRVEDPDAQRQIAEQVVSGGLSRAEAVEVIREANASKPGRASKGRGSPRKPATPRPRKFRTVHGIVVVEPRKGTVGDPVELALAAAMEMHRAGSKTEAA